MGSQVGKIRAAKLENSERLQQTLQILADGQWHTTLEIRELTNSCAVHTDVSELRGAPNCFDIVKRYHGQINGRRVYEYRLAGGRAAWSATSG